MVFDGRGDGCGVKKRGTGKSEDVCKVREGAGALDCGRGAGRHGNHRIGYSPLTDRLQLTLVPGTGRKGRLR